MVYSCALLQAAEPVGSARHQGIQKGRIELVMARLCEPARTRAVASLGLCVVLLLAGHGRVAAQDRASGLPASAHNRCPAPNETSLARSFPVYRLLPQESGDHEPWMASAEPASWTQPCWTLRQLSDDSGDWGRRVALSSLAMDAPPTLEQAEAELPRWEFLERHRLLFSTLIPITELALVTANSLLGYEHNGFQVNNEGWFGPDTTNGGADKASHLTDYFIVANVLQDVYRMLGYSENAAILWGFGLAIATGFGNEVSDGFTRHGFSWEDFAMDAAGATTASVIAATRTRDLLGLRTSHLPSDTYTHDVYSADFKISGLGQRLGVNLGPLRWLLFSVTYGAKGYRVEPPTEQQRQVGFEIGLNLQQILNDIGVKRNTWWGYTLHLFGDNIRFPFTAVGMRYDMNHGKWHGPNAGNYD
jgi:hypothetical protein